MSKVCCAAAAPHLTSLIRLGAGYMLLCHGGAKLLGIPHIAGLDGLSLTSLPGIAGIFELVCGVLLVLGLFSRLAAFVASGLCAAAYLIGHAAAAGHFFLPMVNGGEAAILYSFTFFLLFLYGPGPWSLDRLRGKA